LDYELKVACGFGAVCARGLHPDTICASLELAKERCQQHYNMIKYNLAKLP
jgi:hypothetical protein